MQIPLQVCDGDIAQWAAYDGVKEREEVPCALVEGYVEGSATGWGGFRGLEGPGESWGWFSGQNSRC